MLWSMRTSLQTHPGLDTSSILWETIASLGQPSLELATGPSQRSTRQGEKTVLGEEERGMGHQVKAGALGGNSNTPSLPRVTHTCRSPCN